MKKEDFKILIACEESQAVCIEFRKLGFTAFSCDIQDCSGGKPEWHIKDDVFKVIDHEKWHCMIAFPPCTHLAVSGAAWFEEKRKDGRQQQGIDFFFKIAKANIEHIAIENPVGIINSFQKPDQIIQPYFFGDEAQKTTCLWLKNLPKLYHNDRPNLFDKKVTHVKLPPKIRLLSGKEISRWHYEVSKINIKIRGKERSKTFPGIAKNMASQWGKFLSEKYGF